MISCPAAWSISRSGRNRSAFRQSGFISVPKTASPFSGRLPYPDRPP